MRKTLEGRPVRLVRLMLRTWVLLDIRSGMEVCIRPEIWFLNYIFVITCGWLIQKLHEKQ